MSQPDSNNDTKIIILDFDKTIIKFHSHKILHANEFQTIDVKQIEEEIDKMLKSKGFCNKNALESFIKHACSKNYKIAIAAFNEYPQAVKYILLKLELSEDIISQIHLELGFPKKNRKKVGKNEHIQKIKEYFKLPNIKPENVILLDDDIKNINKAIQAGYIGIIVEEPHEKAQYFQTAIPDFKFSEEKIDQSVTESKTSEEEIYASKTELKTSEEKVDQTVPEPKTSKSNWIQKLSNNKFFRIITTIAVTIGMVTGAYFLFRNKFSSNAANLIDDLSSNNIAADVNQFNGNVNIDSPSILERINLKSNTQGLLL